MKTNLKGLTLRELEDFVVSGGEKRYRGRQLFEWLYAKEASSFAEMTSVPKSFREELASAATVNSIGLAGVQESKHDGTRKFLFELSDGKRIETVLIPPSTAFRGFGAENEEEQKRLTLCVSTQVGCPLDCKFCATAKMGFLRNLTAGEIIDQVLQVRRVCGKRITNLVYMGMGEPLMNYDNLMKSFEIITTGLGMAGRRITVSTAGWVPGIRRLADEHRRVKLAVSLHTLDGDLRTELMPINKKYDLETLLDALRYYYLKVKQRITFEYILFDRFNDRDEDIARLARLSNNVPCKVNLIPFHNIGFGGHAGLPATLRPSSPSQIDEFVRKLREAHVTAFVRGSAGEDIDAACGQLALRMEGKRQAAVVTSSPVRSRRPGKPYSSISKSSVL